MRNTRIYQNIKLAHGTEVVLDGQAAHHLIHVLRLKSGSNLTMFNGQGGEYGAVIEQVSKKSVVVRLLDYDADDRESPASIHLIQSLLRNEKMDFVIQKATELGVTKITPVMTEFSNIQLSDDKAAKRLQHWQSIAIHACEQCGRNRLPEINSIETFPSLIASIQEEKKIILHPDADDSWRENDRSIKSAAVLIGPEGGFSESEIVAAKEQNFSCMRLGPRILRTETAAVTAMVLLQNSLGDLS